MTINYTTLLGLAKPVTGTESGAWGDVVNDQITSLVEDAIANAASISVTSGNVTLTDNNGTSDQARMAILLVTGSPGVSRNIVAPSTSKWYIVKNGSNAAVVLKGSATTGVTIPAGAEVLAFWNGSDFEITSMVGPSTSTDNAVARFDGTTGKVVQNSAVTIADTSGDITTAGYVFTAAGAVGTPAYSTSGDTNTGIWFPAADTIAFSEGGVEVMRINSSANVGIGTTSPTTRFQVNGTSGQAPATLITSAQTGTSVRSNSVFRIQSEATGRDVYMQFSDNVTNATEIGMVGGAQYFCTGGSEKVRISAGGNVGIGTTAPDSPLTVKTDTDFVVSTRTTAASTGARIVALNAAQNAYKDLVIDGSQLIYAISGTERMRIDTSGNVGIGTSSPSNRFVVSNGGAAGVEVNPSTGNIFTFNRSTSLYTDMTLTSNIMVFQTGGATERMRISASGFVGINQTPDGNATFQVKETGSASRRVADFYLAVASSTAAPAARFIKYDNDTTTANKFVEFVLNQGNNGSGQINANGASQAAFGTFSDIRLKENIQDLPPQLSNICALRPVEFDYKDGSGHQIGFIAQEMQQVYPDVVGVDRDEMLTVTGWDKTTSRLVKAIQEQQTIIESLTARIAALESKGA